MLDKTFNPAGFESQIYAAWERVGAFAAHPESAKKPYCIMMPPPNVTGSLHMGHALTFTLQDILTRFERMRGREVLWQPGTDHAGIATQMVVERNLEAEKKTRHDLGRDAFIKKVWQWKDESGGTITRQLRSLGASPDWTRERFTLDDGLSAAVRKVFVALHKEGLIYRDKRLVNWDPKLHTAVSDLEVEARETKGSLWYINYPIEGRDGQFITVATTRPETMLGDAAVAVHPEDPRYKDLIGKHVMLPLANRRIPIIADEYADPETGSGAVKITPAHDFNDFQVGQRHKLPLINVLDRDAKLNDEVPAEYRGLDRFVARKKILAELEALGLLAKTDPHTLMVPYGDRSGFVIEPWLTDQWYCDAKKLAEEPIEAVEKGYTTFVPQSWENTFFEWMRNIQPWCISRQIWWGHQIPAWYGPGGEIFVEESEDAAKVVAYQCYKKAVKVVSRIDALASWYGGDESRAAKENMIFIHRDDDVLDTWFSSALWPLSTLGWPEQTSELKRYYPTDVLVTGFDIIFFWVARMMMMGCKFSDLDGKKELKDRVPFRTVYIHALVRDERGQKMSKSKGNIVDPLAIIEKYGTDALRFTLTALAAQGRDIKLAESRIEGYRNFATKLWNAARYAEMNGCVLDTDFDPKKAELTVNRWVYTAYLDAVGQIEIGFSDFSFNHAANTLYQFVWGTFCDWYIELSKPILNGIDEKSKVETRAMTAWLLGKIVHLLHPIMPFITEVLWKHIAGEKAEMLINSKWPNGGTYNDDGAFGEMKWVISFISEIRTVRSEMNVPAASEIVAYVNPLPHAIPYIQTWLEQIKKLARLKDIHLAKGFPIDYAMKNVIQTQIGDAEIWLDTEGAVDLSKERDRLKKEEQTLFVEFEKITAKLLNEQFIARAKPEAVEEQRARELETLAAIKRVQAALARLGGA